jgi:uncharacterized membrane protein
MTTFLVVALVLAACVLANVLCWRFLLADATRGPWNWRVLVGPLLYGPWIQRREEESQ